MSVIVSSVARARARACACACVCDTKGAIISLCDPTKLLQNLMDMESCFFPLWMGGNVHICASCFALKFI